MKTKKHYTGIGSRQTPQEVGRLMTEIASQLAYSQWTLRSGHALGADLAFEDGAKEKQGDMEIYLPWHGFNNAPSNSQYITPEFTQELLDIASKFHPNWAACTTVARKMHARNVCQIAGLDLNTPSKMVICWTPNARASGGTGQAIRIAQYLDIPVFDLANPKSIKSLEDFVQRIDS